MSTAIDTTDQVLYQYLISKMVEPQPLTTEQRNYYVSLATQLIGPSPEITLRDWYENEHRSIRWIKREIGISERTVKKLFIACGVEYLSGRIAQSQMALALWADEQVKELRLAQIHNPISQARRSASLKAFYRNHPESLAEKITQTHSMRTQRRLNSFQRMYDYLGENPAETLIELHFISKLSVSQIAQRFKVSKKIVDTWFKRAALKPEIIRQTGTKNQQAQSIISCSSRASWPLALDDREIGILERRFPESDHPETLKQIGYSLHITSERTRQIEAKAIAKLAVSTSQPI